MGVLPAVFAMLQRAETFLLSAEEVNKLANLILGDKLTDLLKS